MFKVDNKKTPEKRDTNNKDTRTTSRTYYLSLLYCLLFIHRVYLNNVINYFGQFNSFKTLLTFVILSTIIYTYLLIFFNGEGFTFSFPL